MSQPDSAVCECGHAIVDHPAEYDGMCRVAIESNGADCTCIAPESV